MIDRINYLEKRKHIEKVTSVSEIISVIEQIQMKIVLHERSQSKAIVLPVVINKDDLLFYAREIYIRCSRFYKIKHIKVCLRYVYVIVGYNSYNVSVESENVLNVGCLEVRETLLPDMDIIGGLCEGSKDEELIKQRSLWD